jgi:hypothetical protein
MCGEERRLRTRTEEEIRYRCFSGSDSLLHLFVDVSWGY